MRKQHWSAAKVIIIDHDNWWNRLKVILVSSLAGFLVASGLFQLVL